MGAEREGGEAVSPHCLHRLEGRNIPGSHTSVSGCLCQTPSFQLFAGAPGDFSSGPCPCAVLLWVLCGELAP